MIDLGGIISGGIKSVFSGGALGVLGAIGSGVIDYLKGKNENDSKVEIVKAAPEKSIDILKALEASYTHDKASYKDAGFVDTVRGLVRPVTIGVLLSASTVITVWAFKKVGLEIEVVKDIAVYGFYMCLHLCSICITWYFGGRELEKIRRLKR